MKKEEKDNSNSLIVKIDGLTKPQSRRLSNAIEDAKDKIAPTARGSMIKGKTSEININSGKEMLKIGGNNKNGKKKK